MYDISAFEHNDGRDSYVVTYSRIRNVDGVHVAGVAGEYAYTFVDEACVRDLIKLSGAQGRMRIDAIEIEAMTDQVNVYTMRKGRRRLLFVLMA